MKILTLANQKGGVGKSAVAVQFAYFLNLILEKKVIVIDLDHQRNSSRALQTGQISTVSKYTSSELLITKKTDIETDNFLLVAGDAELLRLEKQPEKHNSFATNLHSFLSQIQNQFDYCIIDTNPNPDIRLVSALVVSDFVLSPLQLNQEAINGIGDLLNHDNVGIRKIKSTINKKLDFIGILPNLVEPTPFQRDNFKDLATAYSDLLIPVGSNYAAIKKTTAIAEAQATGIPVWKIKKTSAKQAWIAIRPVFKEVYKKMGGA